MDDRVQGKIMSKNSWASLQARLVSEAQTVLRNNQTDGVAIITAHILVDGNGTPILWVIPDGKRIEPSKDARDLVTMLTGSDVLANL